MASSTWPANQFSGEPPKRLGSDIPTWLARGDLTFSAGVISDDIAHQNAHLPHRRSLPDSRKKHTVLGQLPGHHR